jgi:uncharacterized YccA/Bax inhibitor family protein
VKSSNPVLTRLADRSAQHATFNRAPAPQYPGGQYAQGYGYGGQDGATAYAQPGTRRITVDDVVLRTAITLGVVGVFAAIGWLVLPNTVAIGVAVAAAMVGLVLGLVISFAGIKNPALILTYAAAEGLFLGVISEAYNGQYSGIVIQAVVGTFGVFFGMAVLYKLKVVRATPTFVKWVVGALIGVMALMLVNFLLAVFGVNDGAGLELRSGGTVSILFSLLCIGIAALTFVLDFKTVEDLVASGADQKWAWYASFGIVVGLVWLYLEILRLLGAIRN